MLNPKIPYIEFCPIYRERGANYYSSSKNEWQVISEMPLAYIENAITRIEKQAVYFKDVILKSIPTLFTKEDIEWIRNQNDPAVLATEFCPQYLDLINERNNQRKKLTMPEETNNTIVITTDFKSAEDKIEIKPVVVESPSEVVNITTTTPICSNTDNPVVVETPAQPEEYKVEDSNKDVYTEIQKIENIIVEKFYRGDTGVEISKYDEFRKLYDAVYKLLTNINREFCNARKNNINISEIQFGNKGDNTIIQKAFKNIGVVTIKDIENHHPVAIVSQPNIGRYRFEIILNVLTEMGVDKPFSKQININAPYMQELSNTNYSSSVNVADFINSLDFNTSDGINKSVDRINNRINTILRNYYNSYVRDMSDGVTGAWDKIYDLIRKIRSDSMALRFDKYVQSRIG